MTVREITVERYLVRAVKATGAECHKYKTPGRSHAPDRIVLTDGAVAAFAECKRPGETPRAGQAREHDRLRRRGFLVGVVSSYEEADEFVEALKRRVSISPLKIKAKKC